MLRKLNGFSLVFTDHFHYIHHYYSLCLLPKSPCVSVNGSHPTHPYTYHNRNLHRVTSMEELKKCGLERCGNEEFLVWKCDFCGVSFCENHRQRQDHSCVSLETPELCQNSDILGADVSYSGGVSVSTRDMFRAVETRHDQLDLISSGKIHANVKSSTLQTVIFQNNRHTDVTIVQIRSLLM
jgi:hypothetical protein